LCDGTAVSRTTYASLFAAISTTWGVGDGSTTFTLPDSVDASDNNLFLAGTRTGKGSVATEIGERYHGGVNNDHDDHDDHDAGHKHALSCVFSDEQTDTGVVGPWTAGATWDDGGITNDLLTHSGHSSTDNRSPAMLVQYIIKT
jgi:microcystin-dependent protein